MFSVDTKLQMEDFRTIWKWFELLNCVVTYLEKKENLAYCFLQMTDECFDQVSGHLMNAFDSMKMELEIGNIMAWLLK